MPLAPLAEPWSSDHDSESVALDDVNLGKELCGDEIDNSIDAITTATDEIEITEVVKDGEKADLMQFDLLRLIGQGSYGKVFLVKKNRGRDCGQFFAMKILKKASLKAFQTEGKLYLILDFLQGGDLFSRLYREFMFTEDDVKFYLAEIACALGHLHSLGVAYRDLKPENILLDEEGHIKLTDFGLAKESVDDDSGKTYSFCGTVEYMAPEVVSRRGHTFVADWWSLGVVMYEMLTGKLPFHASSRSDTMGLILKARLSMPKNFSPEAQSLLRAFFKRNPANRLGACDDLAEVKSHPFFASIDWQKLLNRRIKPPFKPPCTPTNRTLCFDNEFTKMTPKDSPAIPPSATAHELFRGFSFVAPSLLIDPKPNITTSASSTGFNKAESKSVIFNDFDFKEILGSGAHSVCRKCIHRKTGHEYAVKAIVKQHFDASEEVDILQRYPHPNIVKLHAVHEDNFNIYLILELCKGGELFDRIVAQKHFSEREAADVMLNLVNAVYYLHSNQVVHRDLKPSNVMYASESGDSASIRIIDFGFAKQLRAENGLLMTPCYTAQFVAPEILKKQGYDMSCDVWSLGVLLFTMLSGKTPFSTGENDSPNRILRRVGEGKFSLTDPIWEGISEPAKELIKLMLHVDPKKRPSTKEILGHPWIARRNSLPNTKLGSLVDTEKVKSAIVQTYRAISKSINPSQLRSVNESALAQRRQIRAKSFARVQILAQD